MEDKSQMDLSIETVFDSEKYQLIDKIGEGGFGTVYKAKQLSTQQFVAIKFLSLASSFDEDKKRRYIERFHRESDLVRRLNHPNIVSLIDKGQQGDSLLYAVYEYIDGFSLKEHLDKHGPFDAPKAAELMACVLDALSHAHEQGVIHRDIKPANIMLYKVGAKTHVKVLDFGIGTLKNEARQLDYKTITLTQETLGTPSYSAPEQLRGEPPLAQTDIYVWGLVFLECLTGTPTISGGSLASIFHQQLSSGNVPLGILAGHSSANFFRRVLNKKAQERPDNTAELYHNFRQLSFSNLVGDLSQTPDYINQNSPANAITANDFNETLVHEGKFSYSRLTERKQISVLSIILTTEALTTELLQDQDNNQDVIDTFHSDQMQQCIDIAVRYGANHVGSLGDTLLFYFGYPYVTDNDSRLCSRAALDIISNVNKKNSLLKNSQGISSHIQMGMQIGLMLSLANNLPEGKAAHDAMRLCRQAKDGQILCSENVKHLLEGYLNFEGLIQNKQHSNVGSTNVQALYQLRGERQSEAFGFLRGNRKNSTFIGREQELTTLINVLTLNSRIDTKQYQDKKAAVQTTAVKLAHVQGEAGIGKSRLIFELRTRTTKLQHFVAQCLPEHQNNALYPILQCLKFKYSLDALSDKNRVSRLQQAIALTSLTAEHQQHGLQVLTAWLNLPLKGNNVLGHLSPKIQKQRLFAVLSHLFCQTNQVSTVDKQYLFILEDLHWVDPTSQEFIVHLITANIFIDGAHSWVTTSREALPEQLISLPFKQIKVPKLNKTDTTAFIRDLFEQHTIATQLLDILLERTDGIPLFIEELAYYLQKQSLVHKVNGQFDFIDEDKQALVPQTLRDSLQQKLDQLRSAKDTVQLAATIGREFSYELLATTSEKEEALLQRDLEELVTTELVYLQRKVTGDNYIFKHALVRDAAYESMTFSKRRAAHRALGPALMTSKGWASLALEKNTRAVDKLAKTHAADLSLKEFWIQFNSGIARHDDKLCTTILKQISQTPQSQTQQFLIYLMEGMSFFCRGKLDKSLIKLEYSIAILDECDLVQLPQEAPMYPYVFLAWNLFLCGEQEQAELAISEGIEKSTVNEFSEALAYSFSSALKLFSSDVKSLETHAQRCLDLSQKGEYVVIEEVARILIGPVIVMKGEIKKGLLQMKSAMEHLDEERHRFFGSVYYAKIATLQLDNQYSANDIMLTIAAGMKYADEALGCIFKPELLCLKALCYKRMGQHECAKATINEARMVIKEMIFDQSDASFYSKRLKEVNEIVLS